MIAYTWRHHAEWATLVAVIVTAGYVAQARADEPKAENIQVEVTASPDESWQEVQKKIDANVGAVELKTGKDGHIQVQVRVLDQTDRDVDVEEQPVVRVIKKAVQIGDGEDSDEEEIRTLVTVELPTHYLGIHGSQVDPILREHLNLSGNEGVLVTTVVDASPAEKAGLKKYDILIAANGKKISQLSDLIEILREEKDNEISLELIRKGQKMDLAVKPEERPQEFGEDAAGAVSGFDPDAIQDLRIWVEKFAKDQNLPKHVPAPQALRLRALGPGFILGNPALDLSKMPKNLSIGITKKDDAPAKIKIEQGDQTWEFNADDSKAMAELPDEIRKFVEPMLGNKGTYTLKADNLKLRLPEELKQIRIPQIQMDKKLSQEKQSELSRDIMERMQEMERKLEQLHKDIHKLHEEEDK